MGFAFLTAAIFSNVISKFYVKSMVHKIPIYSGSVIVDAVGLCVSTLMFFITQPVSSISIEFTPRLIWLLILGIALWTTFSLLNLLSIKKSEVSMREPINQSKVIIVGIVGAFIIGESLKISSILGIIVIFIGLLVCLFDPKKKFGSIKDPGVQVILLSSLIGAGTSIVDKAALEHVPTLLYSMIMYGVPLILILSAINRKRYEELKVVLKTPALRTVSLISAFLALTSILTTWMAYSYLELHVAYPLLQLANIITVIIAIIVLHERTNIVQKIVGSVITVIGTVLVKW